MLFVGTSEEMDKAL
jgi:hypothetical protein